MLLRITIKRGNLLMRISLENLLLRPDVWTAMGDWLCNHIRHAPMEASCKPLVSQSFVQVEPDAE